jgi:hypothetical protein
MVRILYMPVPVYYNCKYLVEQKIVKKNIPGARDADALKPLSIAPGVGNVVVVAASPLSFLIPYAYIV